MKTEYKHIHFTEASDLYCDKPVYICRNNESKNAMGEVLYYPMRQKYVFEGFTQSVFDISWLQDIIDFAGQL